MNKFTAAVLAPVVALIIGIPAFAAAAADKAGRVDINTATEEQLKTTLGVDGDEAKKIIEARPYYKKEDLKTRNVMSASDFEKLARLIDSVC